MRKFSYQAKCTKCGVNYEVASIFYDKKSDRITMKCYCGNREEFFPLDTIIVGKDFNDK